MLARLHEACIFDFDETPTAQRIARAADIESEDPDFWERLAREELRQDPRVARYLQLGSPTPLLDGVFLDIARMLDMVPPLLTPHGIANRETETEAQAAGRHWAPERRLQVRLYNLLERWSVALADPRLQWISPLTPVGNFAALLGAIRECWTHDYLPQHRLVGLVGVLLGAFIRGERRAGFLSRLSEEERAEAIEVLRASSAPSLAGALAYASVRSAQRDLMTYLFSWQPALLLGLEWQVLRFDDDAIAFGEELSLPDAAADAMSARVTWASAYMDDARWGTVMSAETGLAVVLTVKGFATKFGATLSVGPSVALLDDPRIVEVVRRALGYRHTEACVVESGPDRLSVRIDDVLAARIGPTIVESDDVLSPERLNALAEAGAPFSDLLWTAEAAS
jgi:hypothetical protein